MTLTAELANSQRRGGVTGHVAVLPFVAGVAVIEGGGRVLYELGKPKNLVPTVAAAILVPAAVVAIVAAIYTAPIWILAAIYIRRRNRALGAGLSKPASTYATDHLERIASYPSSTRRMARQAERELRRRR